MRIASLPSSSAVSMPHAFQGGSSSGTNEEIISRSAVTPAAVSSARIRGQSAGSQRLALQLDVEVDAARQAGEHVVELRGARRRPSGGSWTTTYAPLGSFCTSNSTPSAPCASGGEERGEGVLGGERAVPPVAEHERPVRSGVSWPHYRPGRLRLTSEGARPILWHNLSRRVISCEGPSRSCSSSLRACSLFTGAAAKVFVSIATGGTAGTYYPLGGAMAEIINKAIPNVNATAVSTGASVANLNGLADGRVPDGHQPERRHVLRLHGHRAVREEPGHVQPARHRLPLQRDRADRHARQLRHQDPRGPEGQEGRGRRDRQRHRGQRPADPRDGGPHLQRHQRAVPVVRRGGERAARRQHRRGRSTPRASRPRPSATSRRRRTST